MGPSYTSQVLCPRFRLEPLWSHLEVCSIALRQTSKSTTVGQCPIANLAETWLCTRELSRERSGFLATLCSYPAEEGQLEKI